MKFIVAMLVCGLMTAMADARPVVIEDSAVLTRPDASWQYFGRFGVAVDGDYALVSGERYVADPAAEGGQRHEGAAFIYRRASASSWTYAGRLGPIATIKNVYPGLAMEGGVAISLTDRYRIWERTGDTWVLQRVAGILPDTLNGPDIEIDGGRILSHCAGCTYNFVVMSKPDTTWLPEGGFLGAAGPQTGDPLYSFDIQGDRLLRANVNYFLQFTRVGSTWQRDYDLDCCASGSPAEVALIDGHYAFTPHLDGRINTIIDHDGLEGYGGAFLAADSAMWPAAHGTTVMKRADHVLALRNYRYDTEGHIYHLLRINEDANHSITPVAMLQPSAGAWLGARVDWTPGRMIVGGWEGSTGDNNVRIFDLPATYDATPVAVHDFEPPVSASAWQPTAGSGFSVVKVGYTNVYRQTSTVGAAYSFLQDSTRNQAIEADVTLRAFTGTDRWIGLATRRSDDANYYYVTFRTSGSIELKRMLNGAFTTLAAAPATLIVGRAYKLRLESIGSLHRVYLDGRLVLSARDRNLGQGVAGVMMNRAAADWDNVTVTPNPFTTIIADDFSGPGNHWSYDYPALQQNVGYINIPAISAPTIGDRNDIAGGGQADEQVVRARIRPVSFNSPSDWVGFAALFGYRDHVYVSLHGRNVIALWKRVGGVVTQLATQRLTITPGTWYDVRLETAAGNTRVYVDGQQILSSKADLAPLVGGGIALQTQRASADFDDVLAYRP